MEVSLGLLVALSLGVLAWIALQTGHLKGIAFQMRTEVIFDNAAGLVEGTAVRVAGVQIGRVERLTVDFDHARAILLIDGSAEVRQDAVAVVRARSLLGEKYVELIPNRRDAPLLTNGMTLGSRPAGQEMDQVISDLGPVLKTLDVKEVGPLLTELKGTVQDNRANLQHALEQLTQLMTRLETVEFDDPALVNDARLLLRNLRELSESLPGMLNRTESTVQSVASKTTPVLEHLDQTLTRLEPTLEKLPGTVEKLNATLEGLDALTRQAGPLLTRAETINYDLLRKLLREEGLLIRLKSESVEWGGQSSTLPKALSPDGKQDGLLKLELPTGTSPSNEGTGARETSRR